jgi:O-antigen/teichoic acid export membrane protein
MRLGQTSAVFFASKFFGSIIGFVATVVFARLLGASILGQYATALALVTWFSLFGKVGLSESITKRLSEGDEIGEYLGAALLTMGAVALPLVFVILLLQDWVNGYVGSPVAVILVIIVLGALLNAVGGSALQGRHLVHISSVLGMVSQFIKSGIQILLLLAGFGLQAMLAVYALSRYIPGIVSLFYIDTLPKSPSKRHFTSLFDFAKFSWLGNVQSKIFSTLDILLLQAFVASSFVGIYSAAWSVGLVLDIFSNAIRSTMFPEMSKMSNADDDAAVTELTENALKFTGLLLVPGFVGGFVVGDRLLRIYGEGFAIGTEVLGILLFALLIYAYTKQLLNTLNAVNRPDLAFRTNALFICSNIVLNVVFISLFEWVGAAFATLLSSVVGIVAAGRYVGRLLDVSVPAKEIIRQWIAAITMGGTVYGARLLTESRSLTRFNAAYVVCLVGAGAVVYFGILLVISSQFRLTVSDNLPFKVPF